jgi:hypothetical protein
MTLDDEIRAADEVVDAAHNAANQHLQRADTDLNLKGKGLEYYRKFLDGSILNARSVLAHCREIAATPAIVAEAAHTSIVQGLLASVRESMRLLYAVMIVLEQSVRSAPATGARSCSFCGKTEDETKLVAGPRVNICVSCTRSACGVLGIELSDTKLE